MPRNQQSVDMNAEESTDLSAFAMPLIDSDAEDTMTDSNEYGRPRSSSGASALKTLLGSKSKSRNKSAEREEKKDKEKDKDKKKGFFEQFRPRSKSDVSGLKRPLKKPSIPTDHSLDESVLTAQTNHKSLISSQEAVTPMSQILEGQMLFVSDDARGRHKSGPSTNKDSFMSKFRARSNSDSKPKSPRRPLHTQ
ncbi:unnamed protein product, partial [Candidula unifasciata]